MFSDILPTLVLGVVALVGLVILAVALPGIIRDRREWRRRQRLTPMERAMEDVNAAFGELAAAFANLFAPAVAGLVQTMSDFAKMMDDVARINESTAEGVDALRLKVDTGPRDL